MFGIKMKPSLLSQQNAGSVHTWKHLYFNSKIRSWRKRQATAQEESKREVKIAPFPETLGLLYRVRPWLCFFTNTPLKPRHLRVLWRGPSQAEKMHKALPVYPIIQPCWTSGKGDQTLPSAYLCMPSFTRIGWLHLMKHRLWLLLCPTAEYTHLVVPHAWI